MEFVLKTITNISNLKIVFQAQMTVDRLKKKHRCHIV